MKSVWIPIGILLMVANALIVGRLWQGGPDLARLRPELHYRVTLRMETDLHGQPANVRTFLPVGDSVQTITSERIESEHFAYTFDYKSSNREVTWSTRGVEGHETIVYEAIIDVQNTLYELNETVHMPAHLPAELAAYLAPTETIQSDAPEIRDHAALLLRGTETESTAERVRKLYNFVHTEVAGSDYENTLDAVTTLLWREAFCGGQSRLLIALLRASEVPARLVGGLILDRGAKRTTHVWVEAWINGVWVPMDPLNGHFAERPGHYLMLYRGDEALFARTSNINFQYLFSIHPLRAAPDEHLRIASGLLDAYSIWENFRAADISLNLLRIILLLPVGVLVVIFFRSVVGFTTFGTFHPALLAVAFRDSGLGWGIALYVLVLGGGLLVRALLDRIALLHTPRLALGLLLVVGIMLGVTYLSVQTGVLAPAHVSMFPIAILAITIESSFTKWTELGAKRTLLIFLQTLIVISVVYVLLDVYALQTLVFTFPEVLLIVGAAYLALGRYLGMRWFEYSRFRWLFVEQR